MPWPAVAVVENIRSHKPWGTHTARFHSTRQTGPAGYLTNAETETEPEDIDTLTQLTRLTGFAEAKKTYSPASPAHVLLPSATSCATLDPEERWQGTEVTAMGDRKWKGKAEMCTQISDVCQKSKKGAHKQRA